ncbi:hypothetical protein CDAR_416271 [Caerostris darwini]|uniref:Uncharacterized protein n=1 Tax=Caerostris darwini TaxID=1538125 RepID=A0AAV4W4J1_9ARAC|nr:hypothetical protein CDAR_416271 [Caerostris darwini]
MTRFDLVHLYRIFQSPPPHRMTTASAGEMLSHPLFFLPCCSTTSPASSRRSSSRTRVIHLRLWPKEFLPENMEVPRSFDSLFERGYMFGG